MKEQNAKSHAQYVFGYHVLTLLGVFLLLIGSFVNLFHSSKDNLYSASLICLIALILASLSWYARTFALKAQDRAIRAEETLRYFVLTGKRLPSSLRLRQIIALRFAHDEEYPALVEKAAEEKLEPAEIKRSIRQWRADHHRA